jgi:hypothetical protein
MEALSRRGKPVAQLLAEAGMCLLVGDTTMYACIAVEEDGAMVQRPEGHDLVMMVNQAVCHQGLRMSCRGNL